MGIVKFIVYASSLVIFLGILSEEPEVNKELRKLFKEFEPNIKKIIVHIDKLLADEKVMDSNKIDYILDKKIKNIQEKLDILKPENFDRSTKMVIKKLKKKITDYEKIYNQKAKSSGKKFSK